MKNNFIKLILLVVLPFFTHYNIFAQNSEWVVCDTSNSELPSNYVTSFAEDLEGNIWVGTYSGLLRISENGWTVLNTSNSNLPSNGIEAIAVDSNNAKWIGFYNDGIAKYNNDIWEHLTTQNSILPSNCVEQIVVDNKNRKWIATKNGCGIGGVLVIDDTLLISYTEENSGLPSGLIPSIDVDDSLIAWICMQPLIPAYLGGLAKFDGTTWEIYDYNTPGYDLAILVYAEAEKDTIWFGTDWGFSKYDGLNWKTYLEENSGLPSNYVNAVLADSDGIKWLGVGRATVDRKGAFVKFFNETFTVFDTTNSPILPGYVTSIFKDSHHNKWIAITPYWDQSTTSSYGGGFAVYNENGVVLDVKEINNKIIAKDFNLANNYPNPFNPSTIISYSIPVNGFVKLQVFDLLGRRITTLVNGYKSFGTYRLEFDGSQLMSGVYIYSLHFQNKIISKKMLLIK